MKKDVYASYLGGQAVAVSWIAAAVGPFLIVIGLESYGHLIAGLTAMLIVAGCIREGFKAKAAKVYSDFIAYSVLTSIILVVSTGFVLKEVLGR